MSTMQMPEEIQKAALNKCDPSSEPCNKSNLKKRTASKLGQNSVS